MAPGESRWILSGFSEPATERHVIGHDKAKDGGPWGVER